MLPGEMIGFLDCNAHSDFLGCVVVGGRWKPGCWIATAEFRLFTSLHGNRRVLCS